MSDACDARPRSTGRPLPGRPLPGRPLPGRPLPDRPLRSPGCGTSIATSSLLSGVRTAMTGVPGDPFGVAVSRDGRWAFAALQESVEVLRIGASLAPAEARDIPVPSGSTALGMTLTPDGRYLLAASGSGAVVVDVARAERGTIRRRR